MAVGNLHVIRAMGMLDGAARLIRQAAQDARSEQEVVQRRNEIIMLISKPARALAQVLIMGAAAWLVLEQSRSPAIIFATTLLFGRALAPLKGRLRAGRHSRWPRPPTAGSTASCPLSPRLRTSRPSPDRPKGKPHRQQCRRRAAGIEPSDAEGRVVPSRARRMPRHHRSIRLRQIHARQNHRWNFRSDGGFGPARQHRRFGRARFGRRPAPRISAAGYRSVRRNDKGHHCTAGRRRFAEGH